jgi:hypothetical protein
MVPMSDARFRDVSVRLRDGTTTTARATGNNAAWMCPCGDKLPLLATWFPRQSETVCPKCRKRYKFRKDTGRVEEITP